MKKFIFAVVLSVFLSSCGVNKSLYYWGGDQDGVTRYEHLAYLKYDKQTPQSLCKLICTYEDIVSNPGGLRNMPPPGICAEYGYILLQQSSAEVFASAATERQKRVFSRTDYGEYFAEYGRELLEKEIELYPESVMFIKPLINRLSHK